MNAIDITSDPGTSGACPSGPKLHPCFDDAARHKFARLHLPIAPACNVQCNFCNRKYDCANESRPGVTSVLLNPQQASLYVDRAVVKVPRLSVIGIAGPGDPFANAEATLETLRLVREKHPDLILCVATNGLELPPHAAELARLKVSHVTVTVNAIDPLISAKIYAWIRFQGHTYSGAEGATLLWRRQQEGIIALKSAGVTVKVNTVIIKGVNDQHVVDVAKAVRALGADVLNPIPLYPADGAVFNEAQAPDARDLMRIKVLAGDHIPLMTHCARCRADAAGLLGRDDPALMALLKESAREVKVSPLPRTRVAAASMEGLLVNDLLGKTRRFLIYELDGDRAQLVGERPSPRAGGGGDRWAAMAEVLSDCHTLLVGEAGAKPLQALGERGLKVEVVEGLLETVVPIALRQKDLGAYRRQTKACGGGCGCGAGKKDCQCSGNGTGCG